MIFQNRFALRLITATKRNLANFWRKIGARSASLPLGFAFHNSFYNKELNQMAFQNLKRVFCPAGDGSGWRSRHSKNTPLRNILKCFCFPIFSACCYAALRSQFFSPALFPPKAEWPKATY